jgi:glutathione S-transferase
MKLYWSAYSPFVRKVMIAAHEMGLADRIERISTWVGFTDLNPEVMALNPLNQIPTLIADDGQVYADSRVICEYLDSLHGQDTLFPADGVARWQALRRQSTADNLMALLVFWRNEKLREGPMQSPAYISGHDRKTRATLLYLEDAAPEICAAPYTIAHAAIAAALGYLDLRFPEVDWRRDHPRLQPMFDALAARPSFQITRAWIEAALK